MTKRKWQQDKAIRDNKKNKKIWLVHITYINDFNTSPTDKTYFDKHTNDLVYVVDNSMVNAIRKAVYHFGKATGIKKLKSNKDKSGFILSSIKINIRRATKTEIVIMRAGIYKELEVI
jgi:hypothetical protein